MPDPGSPDVAVLLARCRQDDEAAWEAFFDWARRVVAGVIRRILRRRRHDYEDAMATFEERLCRAIKNGLIKGTSNGEIGKYVVTVGRHVALDIADGGTWRAELDPDEPDRGPGPDDHAVFRQRVERLASALDAWTEAERYLFMAKEAGEASKDIAAEMEQRFGKRISYKTVDSGYSRLRQRLPPELRP